MECERDKVEEIEKYIKKFIMRKKVTIEDLSNDVNVVVRMVRALGSMRN